MRRALTFDPVLPGATAALMVIGVLFVYSSGLNSAGVQTSREWVRQLLWAATGAGVLLAFALLNLATLRMIAFYAWAGNLLLLVLTLAVGRTVNGARAWLGIGELGVQPSEFVKVTTILFLGVYLAGIGSGIRELPRFLLGLLIVLLPMALILLEPDLGTALVLVPIFVAMAFAAGAEARHLGFFLGVGLLTIVLASAPSLGAASGQRAGTGLALLGDASFLRYFLPAVVAVTVLSYLGWRWTRRRYFYWLTFAALLVCGSTLGSVVVRAALRDYQIMRLVIFLNPRLDPQGAGWNIRQSIIAIGSGGLFGKGFLQGTQSHLQYLPQQSTDFIFSILAEEWGFLGALSVLGLYVALLLRGLAATFGSREEYAILVGSGVLGMLFYHILVNIGMAMGVMPVTGIPLPFLSYGGSSLWACCAGVGLLVNINRRRLRY